MTLGQILTGERTYFPLPVAYDNNRNPIIPAQLGPRPIPVAAASGMSGFNYDETTLTDAVSQPATALGIPITGIAVVLGGALLWGFLQGKYGKPARGRRK